MNMHNYIVKKYKYFRKKYFKNEDNDIDGCEFRNGEMQRCGKIIYVNKICRRHGNYSNYSGRVTRTAQ